MLPPHQVCHFSIDAGALSDINHRPIWYLLGLAWVPRYLIFLTILSLYASVYVYVRLKFRTFRTNVGASTLNIETIDLAEVEQLKETRLASLDDHGLINHTPMTESRNRSVEQPFDKALLAPFSDRTGLVAPFNERTNMSSSSNSQDFGSRRGSLPTLLPSNAPSTAVERDSTDRRREMNEQTANAESRRRRITISRQLRLLFIYPLFVTPHPPRPDVERRADRCCLVGTC